jgi:hypothetical protein
MIARRCLRKISNHQNWLKFFFCKILNRKCWKVARIFCFLTWTKINIFRSSRIPSCRLSNLPLPLPLSWAQLHRKFSNERECWVFERNWIFPLLVLKVFWVQVGWWNYCEIFDSRFWLDQFVWFCLNEFLSMLVQRLLIGRFRWWNDRNKFESCQEKFWRKINLPSINDALANIWVNLSLKIVPCCESSDFIFLYSFFVNLKKFSSKFDFESQWLSKDGATLGSNLLPTTKN